MPEDPLAWVRRLPQWPVPSSASAPLAGLTLPVPLWSALDVDAHGWVAATVDRLSPHGMRPADAQVLTYFTVLARLWERNQVDSRRSADTLAWSAAVRRWDGHQATQWEANAPYLTHRERLTGVVPRIDHDFRRHWVSGHNPHWVSRLTQPDLLLLHGRARAFARLDPHAAALPDLLAGHLNSLMHSPARFVDAFVEGVRREVDADLPVVAGLWSPVLPVGPRIVPAPGTARSLAAAVARAEHLAYWLRSVSDHAGADDSEHFSAAWLKVNKHAERVRGYAAWAAAGPEFLALQPAGVVHEVYVDVAAMAQASKGRLQTAADVRDVLAPYVPADRRDELQAEIGSVVARVFRLSPEASRYVLAARRNRVSADPEASYQTREAGIAGSVGAAVEQARAHAGSVMAAQRSWPLLSRGRELYGRLRANPAQP